jgi:phosphonate transport system permease protein
LVFIAFSIEYLNIPLNRLLGMMGRMGDILANRYYPPDIQYIMDIDYAKSIFETIQMAYLGALFGLAAAVPLGWFSSFNMTPSRRYVYPVARLITMSCRAVHEMIWAILFVSILGFGMLSGVLALTFFCAGFAGKLLADEIEAINMNPVEATRASGANHFQVMIFGVLPQIRVAFTGIAIYTWDVAFRAATVVGFFRCWRYGVVFKA